MGLSLGEGKSAVELARRALDAYINGQDMPPNPWSSGPFAGKRGVFVTLNNAVEGQERLRGCIGFPYPEKVLGDAIVEAAVAAASEDPRFPPVAKGELDSILLEVSVLTPPSELAVKDRSQLPRMVRIGVDGLIASRGFQSGLLLPQVATDFGMDQMEFLSQVCVKAGLPPDAWLDPETKVQVFQAEIFAESSPRGAVTRGESR